MRANSRVARPTLQPGEGLGPHRLLRHSVEDLHTAVGARSSRPRANQASTARVGRQVRVRRGVHGEAVLRDALPRGVVRASRSPPGEH
eukprot:1159428-Alexandrium_andersonii.AAC.1